MAEKRNAEQVKRFKAAARALSCDDDEAAFEEKLRRIAGHKPSDAPPSKGRRRKGERAS